MFPLMSCLRNSTYFHDSSQSLSHLVNDYQSDENNADSNDDAGSDDNDDADNADDDADDDVADDDDGLTLAGPGGHLVRGLLLPGEATASGESPSESRIFLVLWLLLWLLFWLFLWLLLWPFLWLFLWLFFGFFFGFYFGQEGQQHQQKEITFGECHF